MSTLLHWLLLLLLPAALLAQEPTFQCQEISIPMCRSIGYNMTLMPNQFHHDTQEEAGLEVHQYWPLVEVRCSADLQFFLCATYVPICLQQYQRSLPVCRSVCERARAGCEPLMADYHFTWPERLNCSLLPNYGDPERLCMDNKNGEAPPPPPPLPPPPRPPRPCACECAAPRAVPLRPGHRLFNRSVVLGGVAECALPCRAPYFSAAQHSFAERWVLSWAVLCAVSSSLTVATFLIDQSRFQYPERPIVFLAGCYLLVSAGYLVRLGAGHELTACDGGAIRYDATGVPAGAALCTVVFLLVYFFGMASAVWWVILSLTWFLAAGLKWGNEVIAGYSPYFHLAAWVIPAGKAIVALALEAVDGDALTGVCYVGGQSLGNLRGLVLAPLVAYLLLGTSFLLAGFVALFRIRSAIKQDRGNKDKLEKLMFRIGVFSVLYTVPASVVVACLVYEQHLRPAWERALVCPCGGGSGGVPNFNIFLLRYFMSLAVGVTSIIWVCSRKTLRAWCAVLGCRRAGPPRRAEERQPAPAPLPPPPPGLAGAESAAAPSIAGQEPLLPHNAAFSHTTSHTLSDANPAPSHNSLPLSHV
ncbi:frizzled-5-like [Pollicipes pollicipes]|uniref:frizzled-5-like n=1 Tax=Pollicipes pollicipes TaxID=41117 RepID=UPI001884E267|nr:frizzled-5-like [Pollicipes pollicipes]